MHVMAEMRSCEIYAAESRQLALGARTPDTPDRLPGGFLHRGLVLREAHLIQANDVPGLYESGFLSRGESQLDRFALAFPLDRARANHQVLAGLGEIRAMSGVGSKCGFGRLRGIGHQAILTTATVTPVTPPVPVTFRVARPVSSL